ncbi:MAG: CHAD domain-containing protein [Gemmata sp.]
MADGKWVTGLTPDAPVADAARAVLAERFAVVREFLPLAAGRAWEDPEFVHQLRVGTRRAGAALRAFAAALPPKPLVATKRALRAVRRAAGDARDWDVFLAALPGTKPLATAAAKPALDFLMGYACGQRATAQARLVEAEAQRGAKFGTLSAGLPGRARAPEGDDAPATFGALAGRQLGELLRALTDAAAANPAAPAQLHALRITAKRLRYAIEIFAPCFPPALRDTVYPAVERVQEVLGSVQDAHVGLARLAAVRAHTGQALPKQLARVKRGLDALGASLRARVPAGTKAFARWRTEWAELVAGLKFEVLAGTL